MKKEREFNYQTVQICRNCSGLGAKENETCPICEGTGKIKKKTSGKVTISPSK